MIPVAALVGNAFVSDTTSGVTQSAAYSLNQGTAATRGLVVVCDANGTGSDLGGDGFWEHQVTRLPVLLGLLLAGCPCNCPCAHDAGAADLTTPTDLATAPDQACLRCDAVLNPCPPLGLVCDPVARCCAAAAR